MSTPSIRIFGFLIIVSMLLIPAGAQAGPDTQGETVHVVQWGETISIIASRYGVTVEAILVLNGLSDPNFVYVGQRLVIPTSTDFSQGGQHEVAPGESAVLEDLPREIGVDEQVLAVGFSEGEPFLGKLRDDEGGCEDFFLVFLYKLRHAGVPLQGYFFQQFRELLFFHQVNGTAVRKLHRGVGELRGSHAHAA